MNYYTGQDLARSFRVVRQNTVQIAHEIPDDRYAFRAAPDVRTIGETLAHIAGLTGWPRQLHGLDRKTVMAFEDFAPYLAGAAAFSASLHTKHDIVKALEEEGRVFAEWLESLTDEALGETVTFPAPPHKTRFEMLLGVKEHEMHHRAQLMLIERLIGIVPHLTRARQERQQQMAASTAAR